MTLHLDFSIGPVQGFVAQSRRTRDLWGSSYLLAFLAANAMRGISAAGGKIIRPSVQDDPLYRWVCAAHDGTSGPGSAPRIGSVPNHFVAELPDDADAAVVARAGCDALDRAWDRVCDSVWQRFLEKPARSAPDAATIWNRQIAGFWEVLWVAADASSSGGLLARRKHWRSHRIPDEHGDKCTLMPDFQELSGQVRAAGREARQQQDAFWNRLRRDVGDLELREDERLCAIALVKRLFPKVAPEAIGWELDTTRWPSTAAMAALPWLRRVSLANPPQAAAFAEALRRTLPPEALKASPRALPALTDLAGPLLNIDANYLQTTFLTDQRLCPLRDSDSPEPRQLRRRMDPRYQELIQLLKDLQNAGDAEGRYGRAPVFYALLLADGDRLGQLVGSLGGETVGAALAAFTEAVPGVVAQHNGVTVYAGGDDVLAMLPLPQALACAAALADRYAACFKTSNAKARATLSAAVVFAHVRLPLGRVLSEAHHLLDAVAKDQNGRNSLAAAVLKRGGRNSSWVTTWQRPDVAGASQSACDQLQLLVEALSRNLHQPGLSSSLLYRLRDTLSLLCNWPQWEPGAWGDLPSDLNLRAFLRAELISSLLDQGVKESAAQALSDTLCDRLLPLLHPARADALGSASPRGGPLRTNQVGVDALLLARFIAAPTQEDDDA